jgi:RND superfamily putative drug exporter
MDEVLPFAALALHSLFVRSKLHGLSALASLVLDRPGRALIAWSGILLLAVLSPLFRGPHGAPVFDQLLPAGEPSQRGEALGRLAFPTLHAQASIVLVYARQPVLLPGDMLVLRRTVDALNASPDAKNIPNLRVTSHLTEPVLTRRFLSLDASNQAHAALVTVSYDLAYDSDASVQLVERVESLARNLSANSGVTLEVTGTAAIARDQRAVDAAAHRRITVAAIVAVLCILFAVFRAPLAALVPLLVVGVSAMVSIRALELARSFGLPITTDQLTYLIVIVFGAGTDFSIFWLSRYHEELTGCADRPLAARRAYVATVPGILASACTTILGLLALLASRFAPALMLGPALAFSLLVALLAAMTLMPPLALLMGERLFWKPFGSAGLLAQRHPSARRRDRWRHLAWLVARHPAGVLLAIVVLFAVPVLHSFALESRVDLDTDSLRNTSSIRGRVLAERYFGGSILFPWSCLIQFPTAPPPARLHAISASLDKTLLTAGARDVWSLTQPLGRSAAGASLLLPILAPRAADLYYNPVQRTLRIEVMAGDSPFTPAAISDFERLFAKVQGDPDLQKLNATILATGPTPFIANLRSAASIDEWRIKSAVVLAVAFVVFLLLRDVLLTAILLIITLFAYHATMGLTAFVFVTLFHQSALHWQVGMFAFVILMAVGQDYNLFLISRLTEEQRRRPLRPALRRALVRTGRIISSCGLITAVSLATLVFAGESFLIQMGFALAVGTLLDTFIIRPLLLPALLLILKRPHATSKMPILQRDPGIAMAER